MVHPHGQLLADLLDEVQAVETDLHNSLSDGDAADPLRAVYERLIQQTDTSASWSVWLDEQLNTAAVMWVLATTLVRFTEDNRLLPGAPFLSGADENGVRAAKATQALWFSENPSSTSTDFLMAVFRRLSSAGGVDLMGDATQLLQRLPVSPAIAERLITFWRRLTTSGAAVHQFRDPELSTAFTELLYQDLSPSARARYSLVATPEMVESLILEHSLTPALEGDLAELRIIDPACGSGGFLLAAFDKVVGAWRQQHPMAPRVESVLRGLGAVHGVDRYLPAVVITRFRLFVAALRLLDGDPLRGKHDFNIVVGDALLPPSPTILACNDEQERLRELLSPGKYQVVVSDPPYTTVADRSLDLRYRQRYSSCAGHYALTVPFAELMFELATPGDAARQEAGFVGQFVSNAFMKREFGKKLVEDFYGQHKALTHILDTSGAYIPGRGTPTVVLIGRNRTPAQGDKVLVVAGSRGEPLVPDRPQDGLVWQSIARQSRDASFVSEWSSAFQADQAGLASHPWSLAPPRTGRLLERMARDASLGDRAVRIGYASTTGSDSLFVASPQHFERLEAEGGDALVPVITGSEVRDWTAKSFNVAFFPRTGGNKLVDIGQYPAHHRRLWPYRTTLFARPNYSGGSYRQDGRAWFDWHQVASTQGAHKWSITFSWVATHNQFALVRDRVMPLNSAPVIKLPEHSSDEEHFGLLGLLNSSAACFWLKQHSQSKGHIVPGSAATAEPWMDIYEFTPARLRELPLSDGLPTRVSARLADLAQQLIALEPSAVLASTAPTAERLEAARTKWNSLRAHMIALQEELDWEVYLLYGLTEDTALVAHADSIPELSVGERAFEVALAQQVRSGKQSTSWFERQGATVTLELPQQWPTGYRDVVERRVHAIRDSPELGLLERPEYKRRWTKTSWDDLQQAALRSWILDRCEEPQHWFDLDGDRSQPRMLTVEELAQRVCADPAVAAVVELYAPNQTLMDAIASCLENEHVPYLAALRLRESGLAKRAEWERVWDLQHEEDLTGSSSNQSLPVPPSYTSSDYLRVGYWRLRGKLDVPGERFISYPLTSPAEKQNLLLGWAGWNERQRAAVLTRLLTTSDALDRSAAMPLLAGLRELLPWFSWSRTNDSGADVAEFLTQQLQRWDVTVDELLAWRPPKSRRGRPPKNQALRSSSP